MKQRWYCVEQNKENIKLVNNKVLKIWRKKQIKERCTYLRNKKIECQKDCPKKLAKINPQLLKIN